MSAWLAVVSQAHKLAPAVSVARADPATEALNVRYDPSQAPATVPCGGVQELATVVRVEIDPVSKVRGVSVVKGSGHALFDQFVAEQIARTEGEVIPPPPPIFHDTPPRDLHLKLTNERVKCGGY